MPRNLLLAKINQNRRRAAREEYLHLKKNIFFRHVAPYRPIWRSARQKENKYKIKKCTNIDDTTEQLGQQQPTYKPTTLAFLHTHIHALTTHTPPNPNAYHHFFYYTHILFLFLATPKKIVARLIISAYIWVGYYYNKPRHATKKKRRRKEKIYIYEVKPK